MLDKAKLLNLPNGPINYTISESVPIVCHYDSHTLLTKDGDLIQTIEITGENVSIANYNDSLNEVIGKTIAEIVDDYKIAIYLHTTRGRKNVMPISKFDNNFASTLNSNWCHKNNFNKQLINTIYITFIYKGNSHSLFNFVNILKALFFPFIRKEQIKYLENSYQKLEVITAKVLQKLSVNGARMLDLIHTDEGVLSEQLMFYYYLLHMDQRKVSLVTNDLSTELAMQKIKFNFNTVEINNFENTRYAAVFSLKDYYNISPEKLNQLLQLGFEYILTQAIILVPAKVAKKEYEVIANIATLSKQEDLNKMNGLDKFMEAEKSGKCSYCKQQTTITIFSDDKQFFEDKIKQLTRQLHELGISNIREDFNMAALFFGQLPGNFRFLRHGRFSFLDTKRIGAYCTIFDKDVGNYQGSKWGAPISLLRTIRGTPYYFNFHNHTGIGHTLLVGPKKSGKTILSRFLITQSLKVNPQIIYLDLEGNSKVFLETIGGIYLNDENLQNDYKLNPFKISSFKANPDLFKDWLIDSIFPKAREVKNYDEIFGAIAAKMYENTEIPNKVEAICSLFANLNDGALNASAQNFFKVKNIFQQYFTENVDDFKSFDRTNKIIGMDLSKLIEDNNAFKAYAGLLFESIANAVDGGPCIIFINKLEKLYEINHFKRTFSEILNSLNKKNVIVLINCEHRDEFEKDDNYQALIEMIGTEIFLSNKNADKYFKRCYRLTDDELHKIKSYSNARRVFLVKQDESHKMFSLDLKGLENDLVILDTVHDK